jgi:hypothetical protein
MQHPNGKRPGPGEAGTRGAGGMGIEREAVVFSKDVHLMRAAERPNRVSIEGPEC